MGLKLSELQKIVKNVVREEKNFDVLSKEITRVLGNSIVTTYGLERMAESANYRLDVLEASGHKVDNIKPSLLLKFLSFDSSEVRKLVARLIPETFLKSLMKDSDPVVRSAVAKRLPYNLVLEMSRRFPTDDNISSILLSKRLEESGIATPKIDDEEFDIYGQRSMSDMTDIDDVELTDAWYDSQASKIVNFYGGNIEGQWEEIAVKRHCDSIHSMGVEVDQNKLLDAVFEILNSREDELVKESSLSKAAKRLRLEESFFMPIISENEDVVKKLISSGYTTGEYIKKFEEVFSVKYAMMINPAYRAISEGSEKVTHPVSAVMPGSSARNVDERAVDTYVTAWNTRQQIRGFSPCRLAWSPDPEVINMVNFHLELK